jgi:hypothetical protein
MRITCFHRLPAHPRNPILFLDVQLAAAIPIHVLGNVLDQGSNLAHPSLAHEQGSDERAAFRWTPFPIRGDPMTPNWLKQLPLPMLLRGSALAVILSLSASAQVAGDAGHHHSADASPGGGRGGGNGAPEIDAGLAAAGLVLLAGGALVLTSRRRPRTA